MQIHHSFEQIYQNRFKAVVKTTRNKIQKRRMITMNNSLITSEQKEDAVDKVAKAARKGAGMAINKYAKSGSLNRAALQRIQANKKLSSVVMEAVEKLITESIEVTTSHLKCISLGNGLSIDPTDGKETIAQAGEVFPYYIDPDFKNWGLDVTSVATKETKVEVFEMIKDGDFRQLFGSFGENPDRLCLTQSQIKQFCKKHESWLRIDGYGTFFLFKIKEEYFVACVGRGSGGWRVGVCRFSDDGVWGAEGRRRIVVPQL